MDAKVSLDPIELPFSLDEINRAVRLWLDESEARELVDVIVDESERAVSERAAGHASSGARQPLDGDSERTWVWLNPRWLLPALSVLSEDLNERVRRFMDGWWGTLRRAYIHEVRVQAAGELRPLPESEGVAHVGDRGAVKQWTMFRGGQELPDATPSMIEGVERTVAQQIRAWEGDVAEAKRRLDYEA